MFTGNCTTLPGAAWPANAWPQPPGDGARQRGVCAPGRRPHFNWQGRAHFLALSARLMRRILSITREPTGYKNAAAGVEVTFDEGLTVIDGRRHDLVALDDALDALAKFDERKSQVIELRFFGGLSVEETAVVPEGLARYRHARLAAGEGMAAARDAGR